MSQCSPCKYTTGCVATAQGVTAAGKSSEVIVSENRVEHKGF